MSPFGLSFAQGLKLSGRMVEPSSQEKKSLFRIPQGNKGFPRTRDEKGVKGGPFVRPYACLQNDHRLAIQDHALSPVPLEAMKAKIRGRQRGKAQRKNRGPSVPTFGGQAQDVGERHGLGERFRFSTEVFQPQN